MGLLIKKERNYNNRTEKDYGLLRSIYYQLFVALIATPVFKLMYNIKVEGRENVPTQSNVIYAGNHVSYLDPPLVTYAVHKRVAYMAKKELFTDKNQLLRFLVHSLGGFAVNREKPEIATFKTVKAVFNTPWSLGIFPQGKIIKEPIEVFQNPKSELLEFKRLVRLAEKLEKAQKQGSMISFN